MVEPKIDRRRLERPYQEDRGSYLPTADEIALACRVIQSGWTQTEETKRMGAYAPMPVLLLSTSMIRGRAKGRE